MCQDFEPSVHTTSKVFARDFLYSDLGTTDPGSNHKHRRPPSPDLFCRQGLAGVNALLGRCENDLSLFKAEVNGCVIKIRNILMGSGEFQELLTADATGT